MSVVGESVAVPKVTVLITQVSTSSMQEKALPSLYQEPNVNFVIY